ncbi:hypothetical protein ACHWQZ_G011591 [Mnemiopsis leidyi]
MEETLTVEQILDDLSKAKADDPVFTIGTKNSGLSEDIRKFIKQQTELQSLKDTVAKTINTDTVTMEKIGSTETITTEITIMVMIEIIGVIMIIVIMDLITDTEIDSIIIGRQTIEIIEITETIEITEILGTTRMIEVVRGTTITEIVGTEETIKIGETLITVKTGDKIMITMKGGKPALMTRLISPLSMNSRYEK